MRRRSLIRAPSSTKASAHVTFNFDDGDSGNVEPQRPSENILLPFLSVVRGKISAKNANNCSVIDADLPTELKLPSPFQVLSTTPSVVDSRVASSAKARRFDQLHDVSVTYINILVFRFN